jgi:SNF2 family DNA or RNA helicase
MHLGLQIDIPVELSDLQSEMHGSFAKSLTMILGKPFLTPFDQQRIMLLLSNMRMVCDSTFLIDDQTDDSPKLEELKYMLLEKLDIQNNDAKIIVFSEWTKVHKLIGEMLRANDIGFVELSGKVPVKKRGDLIKKFEDDPGIKIFLSTEAGGSGLNLQVADTLINFELPWNPAKKNQRIGRIDRLGQKSNKLTIYNFISRNSIEESIATGLIVKQNLFEGVLDKGVGDDFVDFSRKGRSQFIEQLEAMLEGIQTQEDVAESVEDKETSTLKKEIEALTSEASSEAAEQTELDFGEEGIEEDPEEVTADVRQTTSDKAASSSEANTQPPARELEEVMNNGMQFLAGLFKMSTGKNLGIENQSVSVDQETGEVTMKFKLPKM